MNSSGLDMISLMWYGLWSRGREVHKLVIMYPHGGEVWSTDLRVDGMVI